MTLRSHLIYTDADYPAGTPCEPAPLPEALRIGPITRLCVEIGALRVVRIEGRLRLVPASDIATEATP